MTTSPPKDTYRMFTVFVGTKTASFRTILIQSSHTENEHAATPRSSAAGVPESGGE